jgi:hypothetical protein
VLLARIQCALVANSMAEFDPRGACAHARAGLEHARREGEAGLLASALMDVAWSNFYLGRGLSPELVQEAVSLERFCEPIPVMDLPRMRYAMMLHLSYDLDAAKAIYEGLAEKARSYGDEPS